MNATDTRKFSTGAVRSSDADATRFDLISPVGLETLAEYYGTAVPFIGQPIDRTLGFALDGAYRFLGGNGDVEDLVEAASAVAEAIAIEGGEERDWVIHTPLIDDFTTVGYPYERIPFSAFKALAETCHEGAAKYGDFNWEKGMACHDILNHAIRHVLLYLSGDRSEPHLAHSLWNFLAAVHSFKLWPHLNTGHLRGPGCTPPRLAAGPEGGKAEESPKTELSVQELVRLLLESNSANKPITFIDSDEWQESSKEAALADTMAGFYSGPLFGEDSKPAKPKPHRIPAVAQYRKTGKNPPVLYLSGPMSGIEEYNFPEFNRAADQLRGMGYPVLNPADFGADPEVSWAKCLERDLGVMAHAAIVVRLPGWENSRGANLEISTATALGKGVVDLDELV